MKGHEEKGGRGTRSSRNDRGFISYYLSYFARPLKTFGLLLNDARRVRYAVFSALVPAVGYTLMYLLGRTAGGSPSSFKPWLAIPIEQYFKWDIFIVAPSMYACWVLASRVVQLLSRPLSGSGSFEDTAAAAGFGIGIATWSSLVHDLTDAALGAIGIIDMKDYEAALNSPTFWRALLWTLYSFYFVWFLALFSKGVGLAHKI